MTQSDRSSHARQIAHTASSAPENSLDIIRTILLAGEQAKIRDLENELALARAASLREQDSHQQELATLAAQLEAVRHAQTDPDALSARIAPVMGSAIKQQIQHSREEIIEALVPVIGSVVRRGVGEFTRELQRNVDARLRTVFNLRGAFRVIRARVRGVEPGSLALRDALPFTLEELFVIQRHSGLLLAHYHTQAENPPDTDLISGMLTAIRDFTQDAFGRGRGEGELDEIQYGDQRIIIRGGVSAYVAVVIQGVEPTGFRAIVQGFVDELQIQFNDLLRGYTGDVRSVAPIQNKLADFATQLATSEAGDPVIRPLTPTERRVLGGGALLILVLSLLLCFYAFFTIQLLPTAFPAWFAPTAGTSKRVDTLATNPIIIPPTSTPFFTATALPTPSPTSTPFPPLPTPIPGVPIAGVTLGPLLAYVVPNSDAIVVGIVPRNAVVQILAEDNGWVLIEWRERQQRIRGWAIGEWLQVAGGIPDDLRTPTTTPRP
jgi:hypothetical protein